MSVTLSSDPFWLGRPESPEPDPQGWVALAVLFVLFWVWLNWDDWRMEHQRHARLDAYRRRHQWRQADVPRLVKLGVPRQRIERIIADNGRRGRGVVRDYQSLDERLALTAGQFAVLLSPDTQYNERLKILKQTPVWRYVVEALYRGEHAAAKEARLRSPSTYAEQTVGKCLGISEAMVHKICVDVRRERKRENRPPEDLLRISEFKVWQQNGELWLA